VGDRPTVVLTCYRARKRLGAYLDRALDEKDARWTERHLGGCASCQQEVAALRRIKALVAAAASAVPEPDWTGFFPGIVRGIEDERRAGTTAPPMRVRRLWPQWAMGGAALASIALAFILWQGGRTPGSAEAGVVVHAAETERPDATVMVYTPHGQDLAVVWVFDSGD
jgi:anti-sigma factor RsiW